MANSNKATKAQDVSPLPWPSLDHLREAALANGCTPAQFEYAVEVFGDEPLDVIARFLVRHGFVSSYDRRNIGARADTLSVDLRVTRSFPKVDETVSDTSEAIRDLRKAPLPGDIFQLDDNNCITIISVRIGEVRYALGAIELSMFRDAPEEILRSSLAMPYKTFQKWLATISAGRRMDTPDPT